MVGEVVMDERARRRRSLQDGLHSAYLESGRVSQAFLDDACEFENLRINADEMRRRIRVRYQVHSS